MVVPTTRPRFKKPEKTPTKPSQIPAVGNASLRQASELVGLDPKTMVDHSRAGKFPGKKIGGVWKFPWPWVREMIGMSS